MKNSIIFLLLFSFSFVFSQENKITSSDLIGYWTFEYRINEPDYFIMVYRRANYDEKRTLLHFKGDGKYSLKYYWRTRRAKCGNEIRPKNKYGTYKLEYNKQILDLFNNVYNENWNLVWIDKNSFGVKKSKSKY